MKLRIYIPVVAFLLISSALQAQFSININSSAFISGDDKDTPGLDTLFVVEDMGSGIVLSYNSPDSSNFAWATFEVFSDGSMDFNEQVGAMPLTDKTSLSVTQEGGYALLKGALDPDTFFVWIVNYEDHKPIIDSVMVYDDYLHGVDSCQEVMLQLYARKDDIVVGDPLRHALQKLTRFQRVNWVADPAGEESLTGLDPILENVPAPYEDTRYTATISETFLTDVENVTFIGSVESDTSYTAIAVDYEGIIGDIIVREDANNEAEQDIGTDKELKGSAPLDVDFSIQGTSSKVLYYDWFIWKDTENTRSYIRYDSDKVRHAFLEPAENSEVNADYYVKLLVSNDFCQSKTDSISVNILTSYLDAANIFVLGWASESLEFKAVYKSIKPGTFRGDIFNRWGKRIFSWSDPERGWDGRVNSRYVSPGVYYYVITATGTDGTKHKVERDLNVLREKGLK